MESGKKDRLTAFPHEIRSLIISFLPLEEAARTTTLSKPWRASWYSNPKLHFNYCEFPEREGKWQHFRQVVDQILASHDASNIDAFEVYLSNNEVIPYDFETESRNDIDNDWILFAVSHKVKNLVLYGSIDELVGFPAPLFTCESLVELELALDYCTFILPRDGSLPKLKRLDLRMANLVTRSFNDLDISVVCPSLEHFSLGYCNLCAIEVLTIVASKLQVFVMHGCAGVEECKVQIDASELQSLFIFSGVAIEYVFNTPKLTHACINSGHCDYLEFRYDVSECLIRGIEKVSMVTHISFKYTTIEDLLHGRDLWNMQNMSFPNVECIAIEIFPTLYHVEMAALILGKCPNLADVNIEIQPLDEDIMDIPSFEPDMEKIHFELNEISKVNIHNFEATEAEMVLLNFLLKVSPEVVDHKLNTTSVLGKTKEIDLASDYGKELADVCSESPVHLSMTMISAAK